MNFFILHNDYNFPAKFQIHTWKSWGVPPPKSLVCWTSAMLRVSSYINLISPQ
jgi:hypothetical protein